MSRTPYTRLRIEGFRKAEASLRLEGMDPSGTPLYESIKARIISGDLTYEQGRSEILAYYTKADTAGPVTVGEMLTEEFLKPLSMSHDELAEAMGICRQDIEDIIYGMRRLRDDEDF
ncbi:TPA: addiction module antidote protein, HigA family, partial [Escherichia coli]|nr:addiction module antidote protein, HigA family [Escherichia coli]